MTSEQLPSEFLPFGHVVGRVIRAVGDTDADPDSDPEAIPVTGKGLVRFTPLELTRVVTGAVPSTWVQQETIAADLDSDGFLSLSGARGLLLWPGAWKVSAGSASAFSFPAFTIEVTAAYTADAPLDLWTAAPYSPPAGVTVTTLVVPAGAATGQILAWDGQKLVWTDAVSGGGVTSVSHDGTMDGDGTQSRPLSVASDLLSYMDDTWNIAAKANDDASRALNVASWNRNDTNIAGSAVIDLLTGAAVEHLNITGDATVTVKSPPQHPNRGLVIVDATLSGHTLTWDGVDWQVTAASDCTQWLLAWTGDRIVGWPVKTANPPGTGGGGSSLQIVGAGRPDVTTSMDAATQAAVTSATVGATFISTNGASVGAWMWLKLPTGWAVSFGDTGWRVLDPALTLASGAFKIRRVGIDVWLWLDDVRISKTELASDAIAVTIPAGFRPSAVAISGFCLTSPNWWRADINASGSVRFPASMTALDHMRDTIHLSPADAWPTTLPGNPAS